MARLIIITRRCWRGAPEKGKTDRASRLCAIDMTGFGGAAILQA
jgi:hypothetical protein